MIFVSGNWLRLVIIQVSRRITSICIWCLHVLSHIDLWLVVFVNHLLKKYYKFRNVTFITWTGRFWVSQKKLKNIIFLKIIDTTTRKFWFFCFIRYICNTNLTCLMPVKYNTPRKSLFCCWMFTGGYSILQTTIKKLKF